MSSAKPIAPNVSVLPYGDRAESTAANDFRAMQAQACLAAQLLKTLANEHRLLILCLLSEGELSVGQINEQLPLTQSALSQHLALLREQALVLTRREAQTIYYSLQTGVAQQLIGVLHEHFCCRPAEAPKPSA